VECGSDIKSGYQSSWKREEGRGEGIRAKMKHVEYQLGQISHGGEAGSGRKTDLGDEYETQTLLLGSNAGGRDIGDEDVGDKRVTCVPDLLLLLLPLLLLLLLLPLLLLLLLPHAVNISPLEPFSKAPADILSAPRWDSKLLLHFATDTAFLWSAGGPTLTTRNCSRKSLSYPLDR
jgi:hypothetical protein